MALAIMSQVARKKNTSNTAAQRHVKITDSGCHGHWLWLMPDQKRTGGDQYFLIKVHFIHKNQAYNSVYPT